MDENTIIRIKELADYMAKNFEPSRIALIYLKSNLNKNPYIAEAAKMALKNTPEYLRNVMDNTGALGASASAMLGRTGAVGGAIMGGKLAGEELNRTPLLTDPNMTYGDFYTNLFQRMMTNRSRTKAMAQEK